jgi:hypothetical protein
MHRRRTGTALFVVPAPCGRFHMQDILWIGLILGLLAATLGYAALCDNA